VSRDDGLPVVGVDAMGGDHGPQVVVPGAMAALEQQADFQLALYGDEAAIHQELERLDATGKAVRVVACGQDIAMGEAPAAAIRSKPDSPIAKGMHDQKAGTLQAFVSAGSTGAMVAASLLILGRIPSVDRPAIGTLIPTVSDHFLLLDAGANVQCTPEHLLRFAEMGDLYSREMMGLAEPRVGLLNIGEEAKKGNELTVAAHRLMQEGQFHFVGNIEGNRLLLQEADVVVTDGFTGNMALKLIEGFGRYLQEVVHSTQLSDEERSALLPGLRILQKRLNYEAYGGALLLGIAGISVISHGRSSSRAITSAVLVAQRQARLEIPRKLQEALAGRP
jgi:glycerol-3-phosphate acyltransferase PlsX